MKITQMKFQKLAVTFSLIAAVLTFVYAYAIFSTDFYPLSMYIEDFKYAGIEGPIVNFYFDIQPFNKVMATLSIVYILVMVLLYIFQTQKRRRYYISNYIVSGIFCVYTLFFSVLALINIIKYSIIYNSIDFAEVFKMMEDFTIPLIYNGFVKDVATSTPTFIIGIFVFVFALISAVMVVINCFWKYFAIKQEDLFYKEEDAQIRARKAEKEKLLAEDL